MNKDKLLTIMGSVIAFLLVTVLSVVGWIALQLWEMNPKVTETARRVDRIVEVLPDVKIHLAQEDLQKRVQLALLTTDPIEVKSGEWVTARSVGFCEGQEKNVRDQG